MVKGRSENDKRKQQRDRLELRVEGFLHMHKDLCFLSSHSQKRMG
jgi:hypothetical protein